MSESSSVDGPGLTRTGWARTGLFRSGWIRTGLIRTLRHGPAVAWFVATLWFLLSTPGESTSPPGLDRIPPPVDLLGHGLLFAVGAIAVFVSLRELPGVRRPLLAAVVVVSLWGAALEALQSFVPRRSAQWSDVLANGAGAVAAGALLRTLGARRSGEPFV